jgi:hypothetical protein
MAARTTEDIIKGLTPLQRARVAEELYDIVFAHVSVKAVLDNTSDDVRDRIVAGVEKRFADEQDDVVQQLLLAYAQDRNLEPTLLEAVTAVSGAETLSIRFLLTAGMLINLTLFTATTAVEIKNDPHGHVSWAVEKKTASPELIKQIVQPFEAGKEEK